MRSRIGWLLISNVLLLLLVGCSAGPAGAAREWLTASLQYDGSKMMALTCATQREAVQQAGLVTSAFMLLPQIFSIELDNDDFNADISGLRFDLVDAGESRAVVNVNGAVQVAFLAFAQEFPVNEYWVMVREDGRWKWCGVESPGSSSEPLGTPSPMEPGEQAAPWPTWDNVPPT